MSRAIMPPNILIKSINITAGACKGNLCRSTFNTLWRVCISMSHPQTPTLGLLALKGIYVSSSLVLSRHLVLDLVLATEHLVNVLKIVSTLGNGLSRALWSITLLEVSLLAEVAKLLVNLWCDCAAGSKSLLEIDSLLDVLDRKSTRLNSSHWE